ncbi:MAG: ATP-binding protein [Prolixibacteraceae bacterium]
MALEMNFELKGGDFAHVGKASSKIKKALKQLNVDAKSIKRIVVAVYEAEVNVAAHAEKGRLLAEIEESSIQVTIADEGPGIEDIEKAMQEGYSTASKEVREMGFGAGMGLPNIKRNTEEMKIESTPGKGTTVKFRCNY